MLKLYTEGRIKLMEKGETWVDWDDKAKGKVASYTYFIQTSSNEGESEVLKIKSKNEYSKLVDVEAVFTIGFWTMDQRAGLTLLDARAAKSE